jgi:hypothetical protein
MPLSAAQTGLRLQLEQTLAYIEKMGSSPGNPSPEQIRKKKASLLAMAIHTYALQAQVQAFGGGGVVGVAYVAGVPAPVVGTCAVAVSGVVL